MATWDEQLAEELSALDEEMNYELQRRNWSKPLFFGVQSFEIRKELSKGAIWKAMNLDLGQLRLNLWKRLRGTILISLSLLSICAVMECQMSWCSISMDLTAFVGITHAPVVLSNLGVTSSG